MVVALVVDLLRPWQKSLNPLAQLNQGVAIVRLLDDSRDELSHAILVVLVHHHPLCLADPLEDHLLGGLSCNPPEVVRCDIAGLDLVEIRRKPLGLELRLFGIAALAGLWVDKAAWHQVAIDFFTGRLCRLCGADLFLELLIEQLLLDVLRDDQLVHPEVCGRGI